MLHRPNPDTEIGRALAALRDNIEGRAAGVATSDRGLNLFGGRHFIVANGALRDEGDELAAPRALDAMIASSIEAAMRERDRHEGDAYLFWRCYPEYEDGGDAGGPDVRGAPASLYLRLSWEPVPVVAHPENFADAPVSLGETRADRNRNGADWTPREMLIHVLRDIDTGKTPIDAAVLTYRGPEGGGYWSACPDSVIAQGLCATAMVDIGILTPKQRR